MDDEKIKKLLFERSESALEAVSQKYSRLYRGIMRGILDDECDVDECENDLLMALWSSIPPNDPECLAAYLCRIARRISINRYKYNTREKRAQSYTIMLSELSDCIPDRYEDDIPAREDSESIRALLSDFVRELEPETRVLFVRRYFYLESVSSLSERFHIKENVISVKLFRARKKLRKILEEGGIHI